MFDVGNKNVQISVEELLTGNFNNNKMVHRDCNLLIYWCI